VLKVSVADQLKESYKAIYEDRDYVEQEFSNFCINQQLKKALLESVDLLGQGKFDDIRTKIDRALKAGQEKNLGHEYEKDIEARYRQEYRNPIPTNWPHINEFLMGGLGGGDLGLIFGNPGGGKSWMLINIGACAVAAGYTVNHYTLELSEDYVGRRYDATFSGHSFKTVSQHRSEIEEIVSKLPGKLIIKEFPPQAVTPHQIKAYTDRLVKKGIKPDAIVIDYLNLIAPPERGKNSYESIKAITEHIRAMSYDFSCPIISATQTNRSAYGESNPGLETMSESMGLAHTADAQFSIWSEEGDIELGQIHLGITKNRFGQRECHTVLEIDYPTLTLKDPSDVSNMFVSNKSVIPGSINAINSIKDTLDIIESLDD
jgi:hypothetical protein